MSKKKILLCIVLLIGIIPFLFILGDAIYESFVGVPGFALFIPSQNIYYGWDAFCYVLMWVGIIAIGYWFITIPWVIFLVILPIVFLIREKRKSR